MINANQLISTLTFCAAIFHSDCYGDGVILPHAISAFSNASFFVAARMYDFSFRCVMDALIIWLVARSVMGFTANPLDAIRTERAF